MQPRKTGSQLGLRPISLIHVAHGSLSLLIPSLREESTMPLKPPLQNFDLFHVESLGWVPSQVDSPQEHLLWEMNGCPSLQKLLVSPSVRLPPLCNGQDSRPSRACPCLPGCEESHFPVLTAVMVMLGVLHQGKPRQLLSRPLEPRGTLSRHLLPSSPGPGPPLQLLIPWSALNQAGVPLSESYPLSTQKLLDSIFPMVRGAPVPLAGLQGWVMNE